MKRKVSPTWLIGYLSVVTLFSAERSPAAKTLQWFPLTWLHWCWRWIRKTPRRSKRTMRREHNQSFHNLLMQMQSMKNKMICGGLRNHHHHIVLALRTLIHWPLRVLRALEDQERSRICRRDSNRFNNLRTSSTINAQLQKTTSCCG